MSSVKAIALLAACGAAPAAGVSVDRSGFLAAQTAHAGLQPALVAKTLVRVEDEWGAQAVAFYDCNSTAAEEGEDCSASIKAFEKSCTTVVSAVVQGSSGDPAVVSEYMGNVCGQQILQGVKQARCQSLSQMMNSAMTGDTFENREHFDGEKLCGVLWQRIVDEESGRVKLERSKAAAEEAARRKAEEEEEAKRAADEAEEAKAEAAKEKAEEEKEKADEAKAKEAKAEEAKAEKAKAEDAKAEPTVASTDAKASATEEAPAPTVASTDAKAVVAAEVAPSKAEAAPGAVVSKEAVPEAAVVAAATEKEEKPAPAVEATAENSTAAAAPEKK